MGVKNNSVGCYDGKVLALFVNNELSPEQMSEVACHLSECRRCNAIVQELNEWALARIDVESGDVPEDIIAIADHAWQASKRELLRRAWLKIDESFLPRRSFAAAADGQTADQILSATANGSGFVRFVSTESGRDAWRVRIARIPNPTEDSVLRIEVMDGIGEPIRSGVLKYHGVPVDVKNGKAYLSVKDFQAKAERMISLQRVGGPEIPGTLVLDDR